jgi:hypothetical protein
VTRGGEDFQCSCPDFELRRSTCKRGFAVELFLKRDTITTALGGEPLRILQSRNRAASAPTSASPKPPASSPPSRSPPRPNRKIAAVTQVNLQPNEFRQMNSLLRSMGLDDAYNATLTIRTIAGPGHTMAYGSVIDNQTQDPTYVMGY